VLSLFYVESHSRFSPFCVESHSVLSPFYVESHSEFSPFCVESPSVLSLFYVESHSEFGPFSVQSILGSVRESMYICTKDMASNISILFWPDKILARDKDK
jgi:hypothetical protein